MSGSLWPFSAAANSEGARKALPSMEREEWCSKCAVRDGSRGGVKKINPQNTETAGGGKFNVYSVS